MSLLALLPIVGNLVQGIAGNSAAQANAAQAEAAATDALRTATADEAVLRDRARKVIGEQVAAQFANGFQGGTGTALDALAESQVNATLDALRIRRDALSRASTYRYQASMERRQGFLSLASGILGAGAAGYQQQQDWAAARSGIIPRSMAAPRSAPGMVSDGSGMTGGLDRFGSIGYGGGS